MNLLLLILTHALVIYANENNSKIFNGENAKRNQFPYQAKLLFDGKTFICGGAVIHKYWILSAAHCCEISFMPKYVEVGNYLLEPISPDNLYEIHDCYRYDKYVTSDTNHDIALVRTKKFMVFNRSVKSIRLPASDGGTYINKMATISGWGTTTNYESVPCILKYYRAQIIDNEKCSRLLGIPGQLFPSEEQLCTSVKFKKTACSGDSGGPVVVYQTLVGIVALGTKPCSRAKVTIHTSVSHYLDWIKETMTAFKDSVAFERPT